MVAPFPNSNITHVNEYIRSVLTEVPDIGATAISELMFKIFGVTLANKAEREQAHPYMEDMLAVAMFMGKRFPTASHYTNKHYPEIFKACIDVFGTFNSNREAIAVYALMLTRYGFHKQIGRVLYDPQDGEKRLRDLLILFRDSFTEPTWKQYLGVVYTVRKGLSSQSLDYIDFNRREEYASVSRIWSGSGSEVMQSVAMLMNSGTELEDIERLIDQVPDPNILHYLVAG